MRRQFKLKWSREFTSGAPWAAFIIWRIVFSALERLCRQQLWWCLEWLSRFGRFLHAEFAACFPWLAATTAEERCWADGCNGHGYHHRLIRTHCVGAIKDAGCFFTWQWGLGKMISTLMTGASQSGGRESTHVRMSRMMKNVVAMLVSGSVTCYSRWKDVEQILN